MKLALGSVLVLLFLAANGPTQGKAAFGNWGIETDRISKTVSPGDDFFTYVNEGWLKSTRIPDGYWDYGQTSILEADIKREVRDIVDSAVKSSAAPGDPRRLIRNLFNSYMDTARVEQLGLSPIRGDLARILKIKTREEAARWMADPRSSCLFNTYIFLDDGNTDRRLVHFDQQDIGQPPFLGLPSPEYYSRTDGAYPDHRKAYCAYLVKIFELAQIDRPQQRAEDVLLFETKIAAPHWNLEQLRDRKANYHLLSVRGLENFAPGFPWQTFLSAKKVGAVREVIMGTDSAVKAAAKIFGETLPDSLASYLAFHWIQNQINFLPSSFRSASFEFYNKRFWGQKVPSQRDGDAFDFVNRQVREAVGKLYVERYFPASSRASAEELFGYLRRALRQSMATANWMDASTRAEAEAKLASYRFKVGYPAKWRDYSGLAIHQDDLIGNARRLKEFDWAQERASLNAGHEALGWNDSPQTLNASYSPQMNAIELPAAFLQPPFFDANADPAVNFGSIGAIIGHEMGHGFDDQGSHFDSKGILRDWWSDKSAQGFKDRTNALVGQYDAYTPYPGLHLKGKLTLGENIGDLSGVSIAYRAYRLYLDDHPDQKDKARDGFTDDQRYFLSWGQTWRYLAPESAIRYIVQNGYHSPAPYRVNGVVRNIDAWYKAFNVTSDKKLYLPPSERVKLW